MNAGQQKSFYWKVTPKGTSHFKPLTDLNMSLLSPSYAINYHNKILLFVTLIIGILIAAAFYQGAIYFFVKDRVYLFFAITALILALGVAWRNGLALNLIWPNAPIWDYHYFYTLYLAAIVTGNYFFLKHFLLLPQNGSTWAKGLRYGLYFILGITVLNLFNNLGFFPLTGSLGSGLNRLMGISIAIFFLAIIVTAFAVWRNGFKPALYYIMAFIIPLLISSFYQLFLSSNELVYNLDLRALGVGIGALFFSFALAERFNQIYKNKQTAERNILREQQINKELQLKSELERSQS